MTYEQRSVWLRTALRRAQKQHGTLCREVVWNLEKEICGLEKLGWINSLRAGKIQNKRINRKDRL